MSFDPLFCAAGDRRAGAALSDLADPRRYAGAAAVAGDRRSQRARACIGAGCSAACCWRCPASCCWSILNSGWFARNAEEAPIIYRPPVDPLARQFVYFFAIGPALAGQPDRRPVQSRPRRRRRRRCAADVGACRDRRDRRSGPSAAPAAAALGLGGGDCRRPLSSRSRPRCFCPGPAAPKWRPRCRQRRSRISSATALSAAPTSGCARWPAIRNWRA